VREQCRIDEEKIASLALTAERLKMDSGLDTDNVCIKLL